MSHDLRNRLGGLLALVLGVAMAWHEIWLPLEAARAHAPEVRYQTTIFAIVPLLIVFGLFLLIGGARWPYRDVARQTLTPAGWALMAVVAISAGLSWFWLSSTFTALGYQHG
ncbi:hypothetical protein FHS95_002666 [Sphingomonas naasensis]|uniref:Uncharacterized protein n=1 Tax=Sphingomonas naasensis TaxID=1344951 RepID=A0A4S1WJI2_9SPHN|nr:hypothetical protein [Sphingomonas naasensis]NIJ20974.1 hypothetical protein [Sphingomonas naasensis]TGX43358.1 hypothetical protein E5A74_09355 [Sphingomonas naasensis]